MADIICFIFPLLDYASLKIPLFLWWFQEKVKVNIYIYFATFLEVFCQSKIIFNKVKDLENFEFESCFHFLD